MAKDVSKSLYLQASKSDNDKVGSWANRSASKGSIEAMVNLARGIDGVAVTSEELDSDPWLFGVRNGVVDLRDGSHRAGDPADLMYMQAKTRFDADARCPIFETCMEQWFPDPETRRYVQIIAGSALVGRQQEHAFVIHFGEGGNGKGTFVRAMAAVFGDYFVTPNKSLIVSSRADKHGTERMTLYRKRLAVAVETDRRAKLDEAQIKDITGGDNIEGRRLYEDQWEFTPSHSLWLQTNHLPEIQGRDAGIWQRIRVVPWVNTFRGTDQEDQDLDAKLRAEAAGILNWLIEGCLQWQTDGRITVPAQVDEYTAGYYHDEDVLGRFAADTGLEVMMTSRVTTKTIHDQLEEWCRTESVTPVPGGNEVARWLEEKGAKREGRKMIDGVKGTWWLGVGFKS